MLKLIIVEDEKYTRNGLLDIIKWDSLGIEIIGVADNGKEGLKLVSKYMPDIVLTDIRMPIMNGLEFIKKARDIKPDAQFIIITGYEEFSYAKTAIALGVHEYLLKPIKIKELTDTVKRALDKIAKQRQDSVSILNSQIIHDLINDNKSFETTFEKTKEAGFLSGGCYQVVFIAIDQFYSFDEQNRQRLQSSFLGMVKAVFSGLKGTLILKTTENHFVAILSFEVVDSITSMELCKKALALSKTELSTTLTMASGSVVNKSKDIIKSFKEAESALSLRLVLGKNRIITYSDQTFLKTKKVCFAQKDERELIYRLLVMDTTGIEEIISKIFKCVKENKKDYESIKELCACIIALCTNKIIELGITTKLPEYSYEELDRCDTIEEVIEWLNCLLKKLTGILRDNKNLITVDIIKTAIHYIQKNYMNEIGVTEIAAACHITPNYLSHLFKQQMGENLIEWLNQYRIEKAKIYLRQNDDKIYAIGKNVGYNSSKYFIYNFKKYIGCTPSEYRRKGKFDQTL